MSNLLSATARETAIAEMTTEEFLHLLHERQIHVQARAGRLKINAPAGAVDALLKAQLEGRKAALLKALTRTASGLVPLSAAELRGRIPLTPAQQGMWLIDHFNPGNVAYNIPEAFRFDQAIELETTQTAVDRLIERHSILRTSFHEEDGELFQSIAETAEARVGFTDLSWLPEEQREGRCRELIGSDGQKPFDLKFAPPVRFNLFRLGERRHVVYFNIHHIVADRASLYLLREELVALIQAVQSGQDAGLPAIELQFADYAAWVTRTMRGEAIAGQVAYWKKKLAGLPEFLELPHDRPIPAKRSAIGATRRVEVTPEAQAALNRIGTEEGASPFMTFLAVFAVSLARWAGSGGSAAHAGPVDFCIGSPMTHRREAATHGMVGLFLNMLAFRCKIAPGMSFREVLRQVRGTALEAYENSDVPFQTLVRAVNPDRGARRSPIFQAMFGYEPYVSPVADEFHLDAAHGGTRYDLSLHLLQSATGGLTAVFEYCTDLFEAEEIERLVAEGDAAMAGIIRDPDRDVFGTAILTDAAAGENASPGGMEEGGVKGISKFILNEGAKRDLLSKAVRLLSAVGKHRRGSSIARED